MSKSFKNISLVAGTTMVSRLLGLVRESASAAVFGTSALASAYATAFQLPNLFRRLLAEGGMTAAFVPTLNDEIARNRNEGAFALISQVSSWLFVTTSVVVVLAMGVLSQAEWLRGLGALFHVEADTVQRWLLAARLAVVLFPYLVFVCLAAAFSAALQTLNRFLEPALSPIWLNLAMIGMLVGGAYWSSGDMMSRMNWFCGGVLIGGFLQMAVPAWALTQEGWRPRFDLTWSEPLRLIVRLMGPTVLGSSIYLINMVVSRFVGLSLNDKAVSVLNYAQRLMELPIGVFAVAVSTVVFPLISRYAAIGDFKNLGVAYRKGMRLILVINVPAAVGLGVLAEPIIRLVFQHGAIKHDDTELMAPVLIVSALGLPFFSFVNLVLRAFYAQKDTVTPVRAAILSFFVNITLSLILMQWFSILGLALASNLAIVVQAWFLQIRLGRKSEGLALHHLWADLLKIALASAVMGLVVHFGWHGISPHVLHHPGRAALALAALIGVGVSVYGAIAWSLHIEGLDDVKQLIARFTGKAPKAAAAASK